MKTIILILLLTGCGLWAQTPPPAADGTTENRSEVLRRAMREALAASDNGDSNSVSAVIAKRTALSNTVTARRLAAGQNATAPTNTSNPLAFAPANSTTNAPAAPVEVADAVPPVTPPAVTPAATAPTTVPAIPVIPPASATAPATTAPATVPTLPGTPPASAQSAAQPPAAGPAPAPAPPKAPEQIIPAGEINFPAVDINQVLTIYAELVGRTIIRPTALPAQLITLKTQTPLTKTEAIQALDSVLSMNGITMINVGEKFVKAVPVGQAATEAAKPSGADKDQLPEAGQYVTITKQIKYAKPSELVPVLQGFSKIPNSLMPIDSSGILIIRDYAENAKRILELIEQIDVTTPLDYETKVIPIKYALASEIASALGSLGGGTGTSIGHSSSSGGAASGIGGGFGGAGGGGIGGGGFGGNNNRFGTSGGLGTPGNTGFNPNGSTTGARGTSFQDRLQKLVTKASATGDFQVLGQTKIIADERTNSLLVFAGKQDMDMITNIIDKLDVVLAQVLIEAIIMEVTLSDSQTLGVSYLQKSPSKPGNYFQGIGAIKNGSFLSANNFASVATNAAGALPGGFSYFASFGNDFEATLTAIADDHKVNVLSRPRIQTSHAVPASLQIGDTVPYVTGTYFNGVNGTPSSQYQQTFVGINLQVTPLINPDGLVVMDITQDIQQLGTPTTIDGNSVPTTTKRTAQAKVSVKDRDTIILGGFISTSKTKDKSGVPILKDIPGLGYLFRSTADSNKRVELIVMIRPTVLPNPGDAALVATQERNHMPGVRAFEAENQAEEAKRVKEGDRLQAKRDAAAAKKQR